MVILFILTGVTGQSFPSVLQTPILFTTSIPEVTFLKTRCLDGPGPNQSRKSLCTVLLKNCYPPLLGWPVLAIENVPGLLDI